MFASSESPRTLDPRRILRGRPDPIPTAESHAVTGNPLKGPYPEHLRIADFGLGCFWGAERIFWQRDGVWTTAAGYQGGETPNPTYDEACSGRTGHTEAVRVVYDPDIVSYEDLLRTFWEAHDPTQGMRQGNDIGTQYRSAIFTHGAAQAEAAERSRAMYQDALDARGEGRITTEITPAPDFYFAEAVQQQYLEKNPGGYCGIGGTGVVCPLIPPKG